MNADNPIPNPPSPTSRRASFAPGQKLTEMFGRSPTATGGTVAFPGPIAAAAANAQAHQRRRMSVSTLGLSGTSPTQPSPFGTGRPRKESQSSAGSFADESAIDDSGDAGAPPASPFSRRLSFGARAMRDVRTGNGRASLSPTSPGILGGGGGGGAGGGTTGGLGGGGGGAAAAGRRPLRSTPPHSIAEVEPLSPSAAASPPPSPGFASAHSLTRRAGEGFNWSDQMRSRAERSMSMSGSPTAASGPPGFRTAGRAAAAAEPPVKEMPKAPRAPDHFQERILKGDFYMD